MRWIVWVRAAHECGVVGRPFVVPILPAKGAERMRVPGGISKGKIKGGCPGSIVRVSAITSR